MPNHFNVVTDENQEALERGNLFEVEMAVLRKGFDEIMHENYQYEQKVNQQFLQKQSVSPGNVNVLLNSQKVMDQIRAAQGKKDKKFKKGKRGPIKEAFGNESSDFNIAYDEFDEQAELYR